MPIYTVSKNMSVDLTDEYSSQWRKNQMGKVDECHETLTVGGPWKKSLMIIKIY